MNPDQKLLNELKKVFAAYYSQMSSVKVKAGIKAAKARKKLTKELPTLLSCNVKKSKVYLKYMEQKEIDEEIDASIKNLRADRQTLFEQAYPVIADLEKEGRSLFITMATIAGAILAFSFIPLQKDVADLVKHKTLFFTGEALLALDIIFSVICAFVFWRKDYFQHVDVYNDQFFRFTKCIDIQQKFLIEGKITPEEAAELKKEYDIVDQRVKNTKEESKHAKTQWISITLFALGMVSLVVSFFNFHIK